MTGFVAATYAARVPAVADRLDLSPAGLAVAVLGIEGGALVGLPLGAALVARLGSRRSLRAAFAVYAPGLVVAALAPSLLWLAIGLGGWALANSVVDVALNAQGVELERRRGSPVLSRLHAGQGAGLLVGALAGTAAAALGVPLPVHLAVVGGVGLVLALVATGPLPRETARPEPARRPRSVRRLLPLGGVAFCAFLVDGAATNWIAAHLAADHAAGAGVAAAGYLLFTAALVLGRLAGDRLVVRFSRRRVLVVCGSGAAVGVLVACLAPALPVAIAGWALVGLAVAPLAPTAIGAAPAVGDVPPHAAIAAVTTIGYLGSFTGPPVVGFLAGAVGGLSTALLLVAAAGTGVALLARPALARADA